ncbi:unnamed protein product [Owenia fusiformis]|uniref:Mitochondrial coenzyme A transporter SLC25A42 n=1 Tax=Owenia fusiformis TaxID=6347 RepID=A0A8J1TS37_OWEFU|nr:unnamed protein product [Owenia fusiformis]
MGLNIQESLLKKHDIIIPPMAARGTVDARGTIDTRSTGEATITKERITLSNKHDKNHHEDEHKINEKVPRHWKVFTSLLAGSVAGAVAKTTIAPLDRTKINFQVNNKPYSLHAAFRFQFRTIKNEGLLKLWRGNTATVARIVPYAAIQYASHEQWKQLLMVNNERVLPPGRRFIAGSLAGVTSVTFTYPLDMVRARMAVTLKNRYTNLPDAFVKIYREEGVRTMYRGFSPTILGIIPYAGVSFFTYETLKKRHAAESGNRSPSPLERLCYGAIAGLLGQTSSYPLDIARRRMQTAGVTGRSADYTSIAKTIMLVYKHEGIKGGLYKGLSMNWIKGPIAVGTSFATFDIVQTYLRKIPIFHLND